MRAAGDYPDLVEWFKLSTPTRSPVGSRTEAYTSQGSIWGRFENPTSSPSTFLADRSNEIHALLRLRHLPAVVKGDQIRSVQWNEFWQVDSISRGDWEMVAYVIRLTVQNQQGVWIRK